MENRRGLFDNAVIWFGVAISVSEIEAGLQLGTMSSWNDLIVPLVLGHFVGLILLFLVGLLGAQLRLNAMDTTQTGFGRNGSKFFAALNVLQLIAWVAVLNAQGAMALEGLNLFIPFPFICIILAALVAIWVYIGIERSQKITTVVMLLLTFLLVILTFKLFHMNSMSSIPITSALKLGFWNIFELSIAMPVSWLPVISDYTKDAEKPVKATLVSTFAYSIASLWMYIIGVQIAGIGATNTANGILLAGLGTTGIIIMVLSTVTTNFLATNSAGESTITIFRNLNHKKVGVIVSILSAILAISGIMDHFIDFLYLITSVFAPMASVLVVSYYLGNNENDSRTWYWNMFSWFVGFLVYQVTVRMDSIFLGPTLLAIIVSAILTYIRIIIIINHNQN